VVPAFNVKAVGQSLPLISASNTLSITLEASTDFPVENPKP